jgi:glycosyltransferase involved in cell wall biosynthesis
MFVGRAYERAPGQVAAAGLEKQISFTPYMPHADALGYLASADAALLIIRKGDLQSLTGKLFEYMMIGRPILACIEPRGDCAELLREAGLSQWLVSPDGAQGISKAILALAAAGWPRPDSAQVEQFSRLKNTERLAGILDRLTPSGLSRKLDLAGTAR